MFDRTANYPCAIADGTDEVFPKVFDWCVERMEHGDTLTIYVAADAAVSNSRLPNQWVSQYRDVDVATARGFVLVNRGPVLALWPSAQALGKVLDNVPSVTALCVASWNQAEIGPWVAAT